MRVIGLDVGERRIGVALSDPTATIASPLEVVAITDVESAYAAIAGLVSQHQAGEIVVGMPYSLSGRAGPAAENVRKFVNELSRRLQVRVVTWDERLSTVAADRSMREAGVKRKKRSNLRDAIAAALILQGYLNSRHIRSE
ncbi:MAG: Holliday junction resolvase RuvX [Chloroflexota bacterium]